MANKITGPAPAKITYEFYAVQNPDGSWYGRFGEAHDSFYNTFTTYSFDTEQEALTAASQSCRRHLGLA